MFLGWFFRRNFFTPCGAKADVYKHDYECVKRSSPVDNTTSYLNEEILASKRSRAFTIETERSSVYSDRNSYRSFDEDESENHQPSAAVSMPPITLGQISIESVQYDSNLKPERADPITLEPLREPLVRRDL